MDIDEEIKRGKWLIKSGLLFLISCWFAYAEFAYLLRGRETEAAIVERYDYRRSRGITRTETEMRVVKYSWTDAHGNPRRDEDEALATDPRVQGDSVTIEYTPGTGGRSRILGNGNGYFLWIFFSSLAVFVAFAAKLWREVNEATEPRSKRRRGYRRGSHA